MKTDIRETFRKWLPELYIYLECDNCSNDYVLLKHIAVHTSKIIDSDFENANEIFRIINLIYRKGNLFERNAIENEFFTTMAESEKTISLKQHLDIIPFDLKGIYIKTIIEN